MNNPINELIDLLTSAHDQILTDSVNTRTLAHNKIGIALSVLQDIRSGVCPTAEIDSLSPPKAKDEKFDEQHYASEQEAVEKSIAQMDAGLGISAEELRARRLRKKVDVMVKGRCATDEQKVVFCAQLLEIWKDHPQLRFGQLLINAVTPHAKEFYVSGKPVEDQTIRELAQEVVMNRSFKPKANITDFLHSVEDHELLEWLRNV